MSRISTAARPARPEPTWEIAYLFPDQGSWDEDEYLALQTNHLVEFSNGVLEVLPMPTTSHQLMVYHLCTLLLTFVSAKNLGTAILAPLRVRLWRRKFREPDVIFMLKEHAERIREEFWIRADLVMEVVSGDEEDRRRDLVIKRAEYARAGIPEYWIVDPQKERIIVLRLVGKRYVVHGEFGKNEVASSHLLRGFTVDVNDALSHQGRTSTKTRKPRR